MAYTKDELDRIFRRTTGKCHLCGVNLTRSNYAHQGTRGAWEVEHSKPRSKGGTDSMSNLYAAHISCNREKSNMTTWTARRWNGKTRAPLNPEKRAEAKAGNTILVAGLGAVAWAVVLGPGAILGAVVGGFIGNGLDPDKTG